MDGSTRRPLAPPAAGCARQRSRDIAGAAGVACLLLVSALAAKATGGAEALGPTRQATHLTGWLLAVILVTCVALPWRRRRPLTVVAVTTAGAAVYLAGRGSPPTLLIAPMIALYHLAATFDRRSALLYGLPAVAVLVGSVGLLRPGVWYDPIILAVTALTLLALAAGDATRSRRAVLAAAQERAHRAEHERDLESRRLLIEERLRISRDLHDQVGHQLALIHVHAGAADYVLDEQPAQVRASLAHIRYAAKTALEELKDTVGLLREPTDGIRPTEPTVGLDALDELVETFQASGLPVECRREGRPGPLASAADVTAYRIVQEALTNVCKHAGSVRTTIGLTYEPGRLRIVVDNEGQRLGPLSDQSDEGRGHGLRGMRERTQIIGGSLDAGPRDAGGFRVSATLPLSPAPDPAEQFASAGGRS
ncbi:histidine kinase [Streptacidiphilus sp. N1-10]|uniref:histidine kinase n=1 Tax=Streptacidiphilus jeojiensis TaxID=3229225 RepID=A0ABV6XWF3_9ACTN